MKNILQFITLLGVIFMTQTATGATKEGQQQVVPCAHPMFRAFDFLIGDWKVYHRESGELAGYDRVGRILKGCAIQQVWVSLDDHFSSPGVPFRMNGKSLTAFDGQKWVQFWVDNQAGSQIIKGGLEGDKFILSSEEPVMGYMYQLSWAPQDDGTVQHVARRRKSEADVWTTLFDFIYKRNLNEMARPEGDSD